MGQRPDGLKAAQTSDDVARKSLDVVYVERGPSSGDAPTDETREPSMASPRLIPVPGSSKLSVQLPPESGKRDAGKTSAPFGRNCAPSQAPIGDYAKYDQLPYGQLHELCKNADITRRTPRRRPRPDWRL